MRSSHPDLAGHRICHNCPQPGRFFERIHEKARHQCAKSVSHGETCAPGFTEADALEDVLTLTMPAERQVSLQVCHKAGVDDGRLSVRLSSRTPPRSRHHPSSLSQQPRSARGLTHVLLAIPYRTFEMYTVYVSGRRLAIGMTSPSTRQPTAWHRAVSDLLEAAGLNQKERTIWLSAEQENGRSARRHARQIIAWQERFGDAETAKTWFDSFLLLEDAAEWHRAGYTPDEALAIQKAILLLAVDPAVPAALVPGALSDEAAWRSSGLPARCILNCLAEGIIDPDAARRIFDGLQL